MLCSFGWTCAFFRTFSFFEFLDFSYRRFDFYDPGRVRDRDTFVEFSYRDHCAPCRSCRVRLLITYTGPDLRTFPHSPTRPRDAPPRPGTDTRLTAPPRPRPDVETDGAVPVGVCRFLLFFSSVQFSSGRLPRGALPRKGVGAEARVAVLVVAGVVVTVGATPSRARPRAPRWRSRRHRAPRTLPRPCSNRRRGCTRAAHLVRGRD